MSEQGKPHPGPKKSVADRVIEMALGMGGGTVTLMSGLLAAILIMYSGYVLYDTFTTEQKAASSAWDLLQFKPEIIEEGKVPLSGVDLASINKDYRCWLTVFDTAIDYPVVQGRDDLYYASRDIYHQPNLTGAIYLAAGNSADFSDSYNVIYGHHMDSGAMFGGLDKMTGKETGMIIAKNAIYDVEFFAVVNTDAYESKIYSVGNRAEDVLAFLRSGGAGGVGVGTEVTYFNAETAADAEKIVALSTCLSASTNGRLVVFGRMIPRILLKEVTVTKVWEDRDNLYRNRPENVRVTASDGTQVLLSEANNWTATVSLVKYNDEGEIHYTWTEEPVPGYGLYSNVTDGDATTLTNVLQVTTASIRKVWVDEENQKETRPPELTVYLVGGGNTPEAVTLTPENGWSATMTNLPRFVNGKEVRYHWAEPEVEGYESAYVTAGTRTTLTNTLVEPEEEPAEHTLKIIYITLDGTPVAPPYEETLKTGDYFDEESPEVEGYKPTELRVAGTMPDRDLEITVIYIPEDLEIIGDLNTPLGLGRVNINVGDCLD